MLVENLVNYINLMEDEHAFVNIAEYIILHMKDIIHMRLEDLADTCYVSTATISRFCRFFGFGSYTDLRLACQKELDMNEWRKRTVLEPADKYPDLKHQFEDYAQIIGAELNQTAAALDTEEIFGLIQMIDKTEDVVFLDINFALLYAQDLQRVLALQNKFVRCYTRPEKQVDCIRSLKKESLVVAFAVDLGFNTKFNEVYDALPSCPARKILILPHLPSAKTCFDQIVAINKAPQTCGRCYDIIIKLKEELFL